MQSHVLTVNVFTCTLIEIVKECLHIVNILQKIFDGTRYATRCRVVYYAINARIDVLSKSFPRGVAGICLPRGNHVA